MTATAPLTGRECPPVAAARARLCPVCGTEPGTRCQPGGDHLGRYLDAFNAGELPRAGMQAAVAAAEANSPVLDENALVPGPVRALVPVPVLAAVPQGAAAALAASADQEEHQS